MTQGSRPPSRAEVAARPAPRPARRRAAAPRLRSLRGASLVRLRIGFILIAMVVSVFAARLFQLQGVDAQAYVAKASAEGVVTVTLPGQPRHDHRPQRRPARGVGRRPDDRRRPDADREARQRDRHDPRPPARPRLLRPAAASCASRTPSFQYIARRVPSTKAEAVVADHRRRAATRASTPGATRCATYPAEDVAANLVGFMNAERRRRRGRRADVRHDAVRQGRLGDLRDRRRQPDPARRQQHRAAQRAGTT